MKPKKLKISCGAQAMVDFNRLVPFKGNPKDLHPEEAVKLRQEILTVGICKSWTVWKKDDSGRLVILDGEQRWKVVKQMIADGVIALKAGTELMIPVEMATPRHEEEAARMVLSLISQHGRLNKSKLAKFAGKAGLNMDKAQQVFSFVELDGERLDDDTKPTPPDTSGWKGAKVVECPACKVLSYQKNHQAAGEITKGDIWDEQPGNQ